jgi:hypothetical protein
MENPSGGAHGSERNDGSATDATVDGKGNASASGGSGMDELEQLWSSL